MTGLAYPNAEGNIADYLARDSFLASLGDGKLHRKGAGGLAT